MSEVLKSLRIAVAEQNPEICLNHQAQEQIPVSLSSSKVSMVEALQTKVHVTVHQKIQGVTATLNHEALAEDGLDVAQVKKEINGLLGYSDTSKGVVYFN